MSIICYEVSRDYSFIMYGIMLAIQAETALRRGNSVVYIFFLLLTKCNQGINKWNAALSLRKISAVK
jgi:hypothetical protein